MIHNNQKQNKTKINQKNIFPKIRKEIETINLRLLN